MIKAPAITIDGRQISSDNQPYIIAELSANHNGKLENAIRIIDAAKLAGADAVKLQTYHPDTITLNCNSEDFQINGGLWDGRTLYELYDEAHMPWEWHVPLFEYAKKIGITIFSSPFDNTAVDLLEDLNTPAYKIASFEAVDLPLIKYVASTGKPLIISTGMANKDEIEDAVNAAYEGGCKELAILHCVSGYPAPASDYNLQTILDMQSQFNLPIGLSDHTIDNTIAVCSVAMGVSIIEKHVTLNRNGNGPDDSFSLEPKDLENLCSSVNTAYHALGKVNYGRKSSEESNVKFRRSLYCVKDIKAGEIITAEHVKSIRPGYGLAPKFYYQIIGETSIKDIKRGSPIDWSSINKEDGK